MNVYVQTIQLVSIDHREKYVNFGVPYLTAPEARHLCSKGLYFSSFCLVDANSKTLIVFCLPKLSLNFTLHELTGLLAYHQCHCSWGRFTSHEDTNI